jgi:hypothetical protein
MKWYDWLIWYAPYIFIGAISIPCVFKLFPENVFADVLAFLAIAILSTVLIVAHDSILLKK